MAGIFKTRESMNKKFALIAFIAAVIVYVMYAVVTLKHGLYEEFGYMSVLMLLGTVIFLRERKKRT